MYRLGVRPPITLNSNNNGYGGANNIDGAVEVKMHMPATVKLERFYQHEVEQAFRDEFTPKWVAKRMGA